MSTSPVGGLCRYCQQFNSYTQFSCEACHRRLVWADASASVSGEKCPACQQFNTYTQTNCKGCEALLPWHECPAARHVSKGDTESEQKSFALTIAVCLILAFLVLWFVVYSVSPNR